MQTHHVATAVAEGTTHPLSYAQESLVASGRESAINVPAVVPIRPSVELAQVQRVLDTLVARHGALRTMLSRGSTGVTQHVLPAAELCPTVTEHGGTVRELLPRLLLAGSERPFAFFGEPLVRAELHRFGPGEQVLMIWLHHAIGDLVSSQVLADEAGRLVRGETLPGPVPHLGQFAEQERALTLTEPRRRYWTDTLRSVDDRLAIGYPSGTRHGTVRPALPRLPAHTVDALGRLATAQRTTLTTVLATGVVAAHIEGAAADRLAIGLTISNRDHPQLRSVVGCLADQLPLVVDVRGRPTFRELLHRVREALIDAYDNRVPLGLLLPLLGRQAPPVFAVNLNFLPPSAGSRVAAPVADLPYGITKRRAEPWWLGDATLAYRPRIDARGLAGEIEGDSYVHSVDEVTALGQRFCALLTAAAEDPDLRVHKPIPRHAYGEV